MPGPIEWVTDCNQALSRSKLEGKFVFLDFFNPQ